MVQPADALAAPRPVRPGRLRRPAGAVLRGPARRLRHVPVRPQARLAAADARLRPRRGEPPAARAASHRAGPPARLAVGLLRPRRAGPPARPRLTATGPAPLRTQPCSPLTHPRSPA